MNTFRVENTTSGSRGRTVTPWRTGVIVECVLLGLVVLSLTLRHGPAPNPEQSKVRFADSVVATLQGKEFTGEELLSAHWEEFYDPYRVTHRNRVYEKGGTVDSLVTAPPFLRALLLPGFTYKLTSFPPKPKSQLATRLELRGHREVFELKAPEFADEKAEFRRLHCWKEMGDSYYLFRLVRGLSSHEPVTDGKGIVCAGGSDNWSDTRIDSMLVREGAHEFRWRMHRVPYGVARIGSTEYRVHTYSVSNPEAHSTTYHVQIHMKPFASPPGE